MKDKERFLYLREFHKKDQKRESPVTKAEISLEGWNSFRAKGKQQGDNPPRSLHLLLNGKTYLYELKDFVDPDFERMLEKRRIADKNRNREID